MYNKLSNHSRRKFIKGAGFAGLASTMLPRQSVASTTTSSSAKNLIFLVVDGMCNGTLGLTHHWSQRIRGKSLHRMQIYERPDMHLCIQDTSSKDSPVTDSAAAASAWGSGEKVNNGAINMTPGGKALEPIYTRSKKAGKRTGLVSTCRISHATPAGFAVNVAQRNDEDAIVAQYLERRIDLLMGGGARHFQQAASGQDGHSVDYFQKFQNAGYTLVRNRKELSRLSLQTGPLLGIFSDSHIPYALDRLHDPSMVDVPHLPEMFRAALANLGDSKEGFFLQVEAGRVDHAGHVNDPGAILQEQLEYDACIPIALDFIDKHPDTLLIVTTDHGTGGCQLDGMGRAYLDSGPALERMNQFKYSFEWMEKHFRKLGRFDAAIFTKATGLTASNSQAVEIEAAINDPDVKYLSSKMTSIVEEELNEVCSVGWSSNNHTSECVELLAFGPGSELLPGFIQNNELHGIMTDALRI